MKILFVNPCLRRETWTQFPIGLTYVMTAAKGAGHVFDLLDIDINKFDIDDAGVESYIAKNRYDVIAFGTIVTHYSWVKWFINTIKAHHPHTLVVVGNSVADTVPEILFAKTGIDIIIKGEGEVTFVELLDALRDGRSLGEAVEPAVPILHTNGDYPPMIKGVGIEGVVFRDSKGRVVYNGPRKAVRHIDDFPFPDWDLLDVERYLKQGTTSVRGNPTQYAREDSVVMPVITARGCVFKCTFCHYTYWNDPYRHRSPENVVAEIRQDQKKYGANYFNFWDDLSFHKLGPTEKFLDAFIEADLGIHFTCSVRSDLLGRPDVPREDRARVARKFLQAGAVLLAYSLESGSDEILEAMNKRVKADYFKEQIEVINEVGNMVSSTSLVFGYPQETPETIAKTMQMCLDLGVYPSPGFLLPLPTTGMWKYCLDNGHITDPDEFLTRIAERQDISVNLTKMSDDQFQGEVLAGLQRLSDAFELGYSGGRLIRTGGKQNVNQERKLKAHTKLDPDPNIPELNYARMSGGL